MDGADCALDERVKLSLLSASKPLGLYLRSGPIQLDQFGAQVSLASARCTFQRRMDWQDQSAAD